MERHGEEVELDQTEASGGVKTHHMRYVLGISLVLAIIVLTLAWTFGAFDFSQDNPGAGSGIASGQSN